MTNLTYNGQEQDFLEDGYVPGTEAILSKFGTFLGNVYLSSDNQTFYLSNSTEGNELLYGSARGTYHIYYKLIPSNTNYAESEVYEVTITIS